MRRLALVLTACLFTAGAALADDTRATPNDAEELVKTAIAFLKRHGVEKGFKEFRNKSGPFVYKDLYIFVNDLEGQLLVHGADPSKEGKRMASVTDPDGRPYVQERLDLIKAKGSGWNNYKYLNPATKKVEPKTAYVERWENYIIGSGAYLAP
jgi:cytochrome c